MKNYIEQYLEEAAVIVGQLDQEDIDRVVRTLLQVRSEGGRIFFIGVGGGAGNAGHAVNDFRKIGGFECYSPTDNVSELTARINDDGWDTSFVNWLRGCRLTARDCIFVLSVGGGSEEKNISVNLVRSLQYAQETGASIVGIVGRNGGYTARVANACVVVPVVNEDTVTPHTESFQAVIWHLIVTHPDIKSNEMKWESYR